MSFSLAIRNAFTNATIGFAIADHDGKFLDANAAYSKLTGYDIEELQSLEFPKLIHPDDFKENMKFVDDMLKGKFPSFVIENRCVRKDGKVIWVRKSVSLVRDVKGTPRWIVALIEDITERKQVEKVLREIREDLNRAQAVGKIGSWRLDVRYNELTWSDENYRIFGIPKENPLTYETFINAVHPDDRKYVDEIWSAALEGRPYDIEHRIVVDGKTKWVREKAELEFDKDGNAKAGFGTTQEITEMKELQNALWQYSNELEETVQEKTIQLRKLFGHMQEIREEQRLEIARHIHEEIGSILTGLKVDITSLHRKLPDDPEQIRERLQENLKLIDSAVMSIRSIISELRPSVLEHLGLAEAIDWQMKESMKKTGISYDMILKADDIKIEDKKAIAIFRIFQDALSNINRHAEATKIQVNLSHANGLITLEVIDNGKGIPEEKLNDPLSFGILGMTERAHYLGGLLTIKTEANKGTAISLKIPDVTRSK